MRRLLWFPAVLLAAAACGRSKHARSPRQDAELDGGAAGYGADGVNGGTAPNTGGHAGASASGGSFGVGGTAPNGGGSSAGAPLTGSGGNAGDDANTAGSGGEAGAFEEPTCVVHVSADTGNDSNDGSTWALAVASVTRALALSTSGCELWLTNGTYTPSGSTPHATFLVPDGVTMRGQFVGTEQSARDRQPTGPLPTLSGKIAGTSSTASHVVTAAGAATLDHIAVERGLGQASAGGGAIVAQGALTLDGCSVSDSASDGDAGGVLAHAALSVKNSSFSGNSAGLRGGAVLSDGPGPVRISHSSFGSNSAKNGGAIYVAAHDGGVTVTLTDDTFQAGDAGLGGGISTEANVRLDVSNSHFDSNTAGAGSAIESRGPLSLTNTSFTHNGPDTGVSVVDATTTTVSGCSFTGNAASALLIGQNVMDATCTVVIEDSDFDSNTGREQGGAVQIYDCYGKIDNSTFEHNQVPDNGYGGALYYHDHSTTPVALSVTGSRFEANSAMGGAAIYATGGLALAFDDFTSNTASAFAAVATTEAAPVSVTACSFRLNAAGAFLSQGAPTKLVSTLIADNTASDSGAALVYNGTGEMRLTNVTVANNASGGLAATSLVNGSLVVENSIFWHDTPSEISGWLSAASDSSQNLFSSNLSGTSANLTAFDPQFADPASGNYALAPDSPCIDHADDSRAPPTDLLGNPRVDEHASAPCPTCTGVADMGAYEYDK